MYNDVCDAALLARIAVVASRETAALGGTSPLARAMQFATHGQRIIHQAGVQAIKEYREIVANPGAAYPPAVMAQPASYVAAASAPILSPPSPPAC